MSASSLLRLPRVVVPLLLAVGCGAGAVDPTAQRLLTVQPVRLVLSSGDTQHVRLSTGTGGAVSNTHFWVDYGQPSENNGFAARVDAGGLVTAIEPGRATLNMLVSFTQHSDTNAYVPVVVRGVRGTAGATANTAGPPLVLYVYGDGSVGPGSFISVGPYVVVDTVPIDSTVRFASSDTAVFTVVATGPATAAITARGVGHAVLSVASAANPALRGTSPLSVVHCAVQGLAKDGGCAQVGP